LQYRKNTTYTDASLNTGAISCKTQLTASLKVVKKFNRVIE